VIVVLLMVGEFYAMNPPGFISAEQQEVYSEAKVIGEKIKAGSRPTEIVFSTIKDLNPQIIFYAQRNVRQVSSKEEAIHFLNDRGSLQGKIFYETQLPLNKSIDERIKTESINLEVPF
jgi:hypothetical protein